MIATDSTFLGARRRSLPGAALIVLTLAAIVLGIVFRFYHLDRKVYTGDEVYTTLKMLGDTEDVLVRRAGSLHDAHDLWLVLHPTPSQGSTNPLATVRALAIEEPQHPPLYYVLGHFWLGAFGNSIGATRALSAVTSLLGLPLAFWLGVELYGSRRAGWIAAVLLACSPISVLYAQEAREYSLWTVALLAFSAAFLRAIRLDRPADWWLVAVLSTLGLYVYPLTASILVAHSAYAAATQWSSKRLLRRCAFAVGGAFLAFAPWLYVVVAHLHAVQHALGTVVTGRLGLGEIARTFVGSLRLNFIDFNLVHASKLGFVTTALMVVVAISTVTFVLRRYPRRVTLFLAFALLGAVLPPLVSDVFGGQSVRFPRYFIPSYVYLDFFFVGLFSAALSTVGTRVTAWGYAAFVALLAARIASLAASSQATTWWNKMEDNSLAVVATVNAAQRPIVESDALLLYPLVLANYLRPDVAVSLSPPCYLCADRSTPKLDATTLATIDTFSDVFALGPSTRLQSALHTAIGRPHARVAYHCINVRNNCTSELNIEPVFGSIVGANVSKR